MLTHLARDVCENLVAVIQLNTEHRVGQSFNTEPSISMTPSFLAISSANVGARRRCGGQLYLLFVSSPR